MSSSFRRALACARSWSLPTGRTGVDLGSIVTLHASQRTPNPRESGSVVRLAGKPEPQSHGRLSAVLRLGARPTLLHRREQYFCLVSLGSNGVEQRGQARVT